MRNLTSFLVHSTLDQFVVFLIRFYRPSNLLIVSGVKRERMIEEIDTYMRLCLGNRVVRMGI